MIICCPSIEGMIEYDHGDQIPAVLLRSSHCGEKSMKGDGNRAADKFLRSSRYQGDIPNS